MFGIGIIGLAIYAFTIYDVVISNFAGDTDKLIWILIVILVPFLGTILWFLIGRKCCWSPFHENPNEYLEAILEKLSRDFLTQDAGQEASRD